MNEPALDSLHSRADEGALRAFIAAIAAARYPGLFNPWRQICATECAVNGHLARQERLLRHLDCPRPRLLLIGEAPGYQGCRFSGVPFTSERLLLEGSIPRMPEMAGQRITLRDKPWSEPSATIVWKALYEHGLADDTVMFNAVPWHPEGAAGPLSNRTPTTTEKATGVPHLRRLLALYPGVTVAALGNTASGNLTELGVAHVKLRHPANGGARKFRDGLAALIDRPD